VARASNFILIKLVNSFKRLRGFLMEFSAMILVRIKKLAKHTTTIKSQKPWILSLCRAFPLASATEKEKK
jgi:hypothetical protein